MKITKVSLLVVPAGTYARLIDTEAGVEANVLLPNGTKDPVQDLIYLAETELIKATVATRYRQCEVCLKLNHARHHENARNARRISR